jgi:hypothetical protein
MLKAIVATTGCLMFLAMPARAEDFSYTCNAKAKKTEVNFTADLSNKNGGKVTGLKGKIEVDGKTFDTLEAKQVTQTWTSDHEFNIQFGTDTNKDKWVMVVETNGAKNTSGKFFLTTEKDKTVDGRINCNVK